MKEEEIHKQKQEIGNRQIKAERTTVKPTLQEVSEQVLQEKEMIPGGRWMLKRDHNRGKWASLKGFYYV